MKTYESQCRLCAANLRMIYAIGRGYEFTAHNCADVTQPTDHELARLRSPDPITKGTK